MESEQTALYMQGIKKTFFGVYALNGVDFKVKRKTVHALMGENGAGKSTLMKVLAGVHLADEGTVTLMGREVLFSNPRQAIENGVAMIYQELNPIAEMTIAENLYLGREPMKNNRVVIDYKQMYANAVELLKKVSLDLPPTLQMKSLTVAQSQLVEIAKAIDHQAELIIMDEPTSALSEPEIRNLFRIIHQLIDQDKTIIYISHKLDEVFEIADEITVLRDGNYVGTYPTGEMNKNLLIQKMVDRELTEIFPVRKNHCSDHIKIAFDDLCRRGEFEHISFDVHEGEILGMVGLLGAGRTQIVQAIFGATKLDSGSITVDGKPVRIRRPNDAMRRRIGLVTEDRKMSGLVLPMNVKDNLTLAHLPQLCSKGMLIRKTREVAAAKEYVQKLNIKISHLEQLVQNLSGGNQQKVVIGKWLMTNPDILVLDEPTRGIDVGAKSEIYQLISDLADHGMTVIMISSEMEEILGLCDRMVVFHEGHESGELSRADATQEKLLRLATGN